MIDACSSFLAWALFIAHYECVANSSWYIEIVTLEQDFQPDKFFILPEGTFFPYSRCHAQQLTLL